MPVITLKDCIFNLKLSLSHRLSGKFSLPRQLVPDIGKMLEKLKNPGPSEKCPVFPGLIFLKRVRGNPVTLPAAADV